MLLMLINLLLMIELQDGKPKLSIIVIIIIIGIIIVMMTMMLLLFCCYGT